MEQADNSEGCGSFAIEAKAQFFNQIDGVLSVPTARIRGDIDTPAGYLVHPRQVITGSRMTRRLHVAPATLLTIHSSWFQ